MRRRLRISRPVRIWIAEASCNAGKALVVFGVMFLGGLALSKAVFLAAVGG
jgi:hypothetical protein